MHSILVYQASSRTGHHIVPTPETPEQSQARRTKGWPEHDPNPANCTGAGHSTCVKNGEHSWFNHSQDSYRAHPHISNYPPGY